MFVVYFDWDSDELDEAAQVVIAEAQAAAEKLGSGDISVIGNTDLSGPQSYNDGLAQRRAQAVAAALVARGFSAEVVDQEGCGETRPLIQTEDGVRKRLNRRVEIILDRNSLTARQ